LCANVSPRCGKQSPCLRHNFAKWRQGVVHPFQLKAEDQPPSWQNQVCSVDVIAEYKEYENFVTIDIIATKQRHIQQFGQVLSSHFLGCTFLWKKLRQEKLMCIFLYNISSHFFKVYLCYTSSVEAGGLHPFCMP